MALTSLLSTLASNYFKGGRWLYKNDDSGLKAQINLIITKVNEVLAAVGTGTGYLPFLALGDSSTYYAGGDAWMLFDGVNPVQVSMIHFQDQNDGSWQALTIQSGATNVSAV